MCRRCVFWAHKREALQCLPGGTVWEGNSVLAKSVPRWSALCDVQENESNSIRSMRTACICSRNQRAENTWLRQEPEDHVLVLSAYYVPGQPGPRESMGTQANRVPALNGTWSLAKEANFKGREPSYDFNISQASEIAGLKMMTSAMREKYRCNGKQVAWDLTQHPSLGPQRDLQTLRVNNNNKCSHFLGLGNLLVTRYFPYIISFETGIDTGVSTSESLIVCN